MLYIGFHAPATRFKRAVTAHELRCLAHTGRSLPALAMLGMLRKTNMPGVALKLGGLVIRSTMTCSQDATGDGRPFNPRSKHHIYQSSLWAVRWRGGQRELLPSNRTADHAA